MTVKRKKICSKHAIIQDVALATHDSGVKTWQEKQSLPGRSHALAGTASPGNNHQQHPYSLLPLTDPPSGLGTAVLPV